MKIYQEYSLTIVEKELLKQFINATLNGDKFIILGAQEISKILNLSRPRIYAILKNLESKKILEKFKRKGFILTNKGENLIHELIHREKILETYFFQELGFSIENSVDEASTISMYISSFLINSLCERLHMPKVCPHGFKISHDLSTH